MIFQYHTFTLHCEGMSCPFLLSCNAHWMFVCLSHFFFSFTTNSWSRIKNKSIGPFCLVCFNLDLSNLLFRYWNTEIIIIIVVVNNNECHIYDSYPLMSFNTRHKWDPSHTLHFMLTPSWRAYYYCWRYTIHPTWYKDHRSTPDSFVKSLGKS